jgi:hypothetical protein
MLPTVAPGKNSGGAPYRQLCPAYPSQTTIAPDFRRSSSPRDRAKGSAGTFQRGKVSGSQQPTTSPERHFSKALPQVPAQLCGTHGTHQAWIDSRNLTTITTEWKHRQPIFLHPTVETGAISPSFPSSTLNHVRRASLLNPSPASTLAVFHSIERLAHRKNEP